MRSLSSAGHGRRVGRFGEAGESVGLSILAPAGGTNVECWLLGTAGCWGGEDASLLRQ